MLTFLSENLATIIIAVIVIGILAAIITMYENKRHNRLSMKIFFQAHKILFCHNLR